MADPDLILSRERIDAVLLDLDGVVTDTTDLQALAWKRLFDTWLREHPSAPGEDHSPFDATRAGSHADGVSEPGTPQAHDEDPDQHLQFENPAGAMERLAARRSQRQIRGGQHTGDEQ